MDFLLLARHLRMLVLSSVTGVSLHTSMHKTRELVQNCAI